MQNKESQRWRNIGNIRNKYDIFFITKCIREAYVYYGLKHMKQNAHTILISERGSKSNFTKEKKF